MSASTPTTAPSTVAATPTRGVFILLEGLDRSGKSSQCVKLADRLNADQPNSTLQMRFPDRETAIGKMIDAYLKQSTEIDDHAIHLLFSANRWEKNSLMQSTLQSGRHLVVDRYAYSGIAFTSSKQASNPSLDLTWTTAPDRGLIAPDVVIFLDISTEDAAKRGSFGEERYEKTEIQNRVRTLFGTLRTQAGAAASENKVEGETFGAGVEWQVINAGQSMEAVQNDIYAVAKKAIQTYQNQPVKYL